MTGPAGAARRPTLERVAALAGVSRGTASRVLSGSPNVSDLAVAQVRAAAAALGYRPNLAARSLVTGRTGLIGFVVNESEDRVFGDPFFARVARGAARAVDGTDYALVLIMVTSSRQRDQLADLAATRLDGMLVVSSHDTSHLVEQLANAPVEVVFAGRTPDEAGTQGPPASWVDCDSVAGAGDAVRHLVSRGRRRIATIAGPLDMAAGRDRMAGWRAALGEAGLPETDDLIGYGDFGADSAQQATRTLLRTRPDIDALFVASDTMALAALRVLREHGRRVPDDVAVVGFDDIPAAAHQDPPLTTIRQDVDALGRRTAEVLLDRLQGATEIVRDVLPVSLVVRGTS